MATDPDTTGPPRGSNQWWIGLDSWVLQDGTYTDFAVGDQRWFAWSSTSTLANASRERLAARPGPEGWTVEEIRIDRTPLVRVDPGDRRDPSWLPPGERPTVVRDDTRETWMATDRTRMWEDDAPYRLRCTLHPEPPRRSMPSRRSPHEPQAT